MCCDPMFRTISLFKSSKLLLKKMNLSKLTSTFLMLLSATTVLCMESSCILSTVRTSRGTAPQCLCDGVSINDNVLEQQLSVNVEVRCMNSCMTSNQEVIDTCEASNQLGFNQAVQKASEICCGRCGGRMKNNICTRIFLDSRNIPIPSSGCSNKVRFVGSGVSYQCKCAPNRVVDSEFNVMSGVNDRCIGNCSQDVLKSICRLDNDIEDIMNMEKSLFGYCCLKCGEWKNNMVLDQDRTCGVNV